MAKVAFIDPARCDKAPTCPAKRMCPEKAIIKKKDAGMVMNFLGFGTAEVVMEKCTGCGLCTKYCPHGAIKIIKKQKY